VAGAPEKSLRSEKSMPRLLHQWLLRLHPPAFRQRFSLEILCIFDHATAYKKRTANALCASNKMRTANALCASNKMRTANALCASKKSSCAWALVFDAFVSLMRQWLLRSGSWRLLAAVAGASVQLLIGGFIFVALGRGHAVRETAPALDPALGNLIRIVLGTGCGLVLTVAAASLWTSAFIRRRSRSLRIGAH
jgi:hypothetical protein